MSSLWTVACLNIRSCCVNEGSGEQMHAKCESWKGYFPNGDVNVKGHLSNNLPYWELVVKLPEPVISIIRQGYIPQVPLESFSKNLSA